MISKPENTKMYWKEYLHQCVEIGSGALAIDIIISFFLGAVTTVQTAYQLVSPLVPAQTIAQIVRDSVLLELSPTVLCIVLAGVVGSKISSELGNMRATEQIDALEIMGINPASYLVWPKIAAAITIIPCLITLSCVIGIFGGRVAGAASHIVAPNIFDRGLRQNLNVFNIWFMIIKSYVFAFLVGSISSFFGFTVKGGALEIGRASTKAVVVTCISILIGDYLLSALLL